MSKIQSVEFDKYMWTPVAAHQWLIKNHLYPSKSYHETDNYYRFRLEPPEIFSRFYTKKLSKGILGTIGVY